jgi:alkanesulfonate monooxygenase SsuD/methylene tetrahydromethanopterin reductase-like flavin-dependent oxidoreductase (luciferase family)
MNVIQALGVSGFGKAEQFAAALAGKLKARGLAKSAVRYGVQIPAHICHSEEETAHAVEQARFMYRMSGQLVQNTQQIKAGFFLPPTEPVESADVSIEQCVSGSMIGSPDHAKRLVERMESLGVTDLSLNFEFGDLTHEQRCKSLREVAMALNLSR